jgi:peptide/nickel transport system substrate-binding protein
MIIAGVATAVAATGLVACAGSEEPSGPRTLTVAVDNLFYLDPPYTSAFLDCGMSATYEPLFRKSEVTGEWLPILAESVTVSEDRKTFTLVLREGVTFTDGTPLEAESVAAVLNEIWFDENNYTLPVNTESGLEIEAVDDMTLEISADVPITDTLPVGIGIPSPTAYLDPEKRATLKDAPIGTGPYLREEVVPEVSATYVRNPDYWNADAIEFDSVTCQIFNDPVAVLNALTTGQVDVGVITSDFAAEAEDNGLSLYLSPADVSNLFVMTDTAGHVNPAIGDKRVRQAMAMAFDREAILEQTQNGLGGASSQVFGENHPAYVEGGDDRYPFDPERARELLAEAGYADGFDLVIPWPADPGPYGGQFNSDLEPIILQSLGDIGIRVTFEVTDDPSGKNPNYAAFYIRADPGSIFIYGSGQGADDWGRAFGERGNQLLDQITSGTQSESDAAWAEFGELALDEAWFIPVSQIVGAIWASQSDIEIDTSKYLYPGLHEYHPAK